MDDKGSAKIKKVGEAADKAGKKGKDAAKKMTSEFKKTGSSVDGVSGSFSKLLVPLASIAAAVLTLKKLTSVVLDLARAFGEQELAVLKLEAALRAQGILVPGMVEYYSYLAAEFQKVTRYGDEAVIALMAMLTTLGVMPKDMEEATQATLKLAAVFGMDLQTAARYVAMAMEGHVTFLARYVIAFKGVEQGALSSADALRIINEELGPAAQAQAKGYIGTVDQLTNAWGDFREELGALVAPTLLTVIGYMRQLIEEVRDVLGLRTAEELLDQYEGISRQLKVATMQSSLWWKELQKIEKEGKKWFETQADYERRRSDVEEKYRDRAQKVLDLKNEQMKVEEKLAKILVPTMPKVPTPEARETAEEERKRIAKTKEMEAAILKLSNTERELLKIEKERALTMGVPEKVVNEWYRLNVEVLDATDKAKAKAKADKEAEKASAKLDVELKKAANTNKQLQDEYDNLTMSEEELIDKWEEEMLLIPKINEELVKQVAERRRLNLALEKTKGLLDKYKDLQKEIGKILDPEGAAKKAIEDRYKAWMKILDDMAEKYKDNDEKMAEIDELRAAAKLAYAKQLADLEESLWDKVTDTMSAAWDEAVRGMQRAFSDLFYNVLKGEMDSFEDIWKAFCDALVRAWSNALGAMVTNALFGQGGTGGFFGGLVKNLFGIGGGNWGAGGLGWAGTVAGSASGANSMVWLQKGGITRGPSIVGEAGPEAVVPLPGGREIPVEFKGEREAGQTVINNFFINAADAKSFDDMVRRNPRAIIKSVTENAQRAGPLRGALNF